MGEMFRRRIALGHDRHGRIKSELVERINTLKARSGCTSFPTDVNQLAFCAGIQGVRYVPLAVRGRLVREPGGVVAEIQSDLTPQDRRFVLAHEVTHLILERDAIERSETRLDRSRGSGGIGHRAIELLCDYGAAEMLLPTAALRNELRKVQPSLELVMSITKEADCSLELVAHRICERLAGWENGWDDISFLWWKFTDETGLLRQSIPITSELIELVEDAKSLSFSALGARIVVFGKERIWVGSGPRTFDGQALCVAPAEVVMLVSPRIS